MSLLDPPFGSLLDPPFGSPLDPPFGSPWITRMSSNLRQINANEAQSLQNDKALLSLACRTVVSEDSDCAAFDGTEADIARVGYLFYEGLADSIDPGVLRRGSLVVVGDVLVQCCLCHWAKDIGRDRFVLVHPLLDDPIDLLAIEERSMAHEPSPGHEKPSPGEWVVDSYDHWRDKINYVRVFGRPD